MSKIRFVVIVPEQGSAYYREPGGALIQVPVGAGGLVTVPEVGSYKGGDEGEVDWSCAFESEAEKEPVRAVERALRAIPDDLADSIDPCRFNLSIRLGEEEMQSAEAVSHALRQAADAIEAGGELHGHIYTSSGDRRVGGYSGNLAHPED
jgi:hypothetical protein